MFPSTDFVAARSEAITCLLNVDNESNENPQFHAELVSAVAEYQDLFLGSSPNLQEVASDTSVIVDAISAGGHRMRENGMNNKWFRRYPWVMAIIAVLLWPIFDWNLTYKAWYGTYDAFPQQGDCTGVDAYCVGDPSSVFLFLFMNLTVLFPGFFFATALFLKSWGQYLEARYW